MRLPTEAVTNFFAVTAANRPRLKWMVELRRAQADQNDRSSKRENSAID